MRLDGLRVLVTGAGSGIGRAIAVEAAARGMTLALCGRTRSTLEGTARLIAGPAPLIVVADIASAEGRRDIVDALARTWPGLDILVNNAGVVEGGALRGAGDDALERVFQTNVIGPMALTRDLLPLLSAARASGGCPRVVNVGSMFGEIPYPSFVAYSASKSALRGFSVALRREWAALGIGITLAAPRATRTPAASAFASLIETTGMTLDTPEVVARAIWNAVERDRDTVYPAGAERFYMVLQALFPKLIDRAIAGQSPVPTQS
jgi:short-subunit dehydrogenase